MKAKIMSSKYWTLISVSFLLAFSSKQQLGIWMTSLLTWSRISSLRSTINSSVTWTRRNAALLCMAYILQWFSRNRLALPKCISLPPQKIELTEEDQQKISSSSCLEQFLSICPAFLHNDLSLTAFQNHFQNDWKERMASRFALSFFDRCLRD